MIGIKTLLLPFVLIFCKPGTGTTAGWLNAVLEKGKLLSTDSSALETWFYGKKSGKLPVNGLNENKIILEEENISCKIYFLRYFFDVFLQKPPAFEIKKISLTLTGRLIPIVLFVYVPIKIQTKRHGQIRLGNPEAATAAG